MPTHAFMQVDAFTDRPLGGNPCAILFDADDLSADTMQAIALENNLSETAFVLAPTDQSCDFRVRYFTPAEEVPLAGHPTIATTHALIDTGRLAFDGTPTTITLRLQVGPIRVDITPDPSTDLPLITMTQQQPQFIREHDIESAAAIFGLTPADLIPGKPIQTVSTGTPQMMIPVKDHDTLRSAIVNHGEYPSFREREGFFSAHLFAVRGITDCGDTFARHFGTPPDVFEDPFTGSATGNMGAYLWHHGLIDAPTFTAEQGHWMDRPGIARAEVVGPRENIETVRITGTAATILRGEMLV